MHLILTIKVSVFPVCFFSKRHNGKGRKDKVLITENFLLPIIKGGCITYFSNLMERLQLHRS